MRRNAFARIFCYQVSSIFSLSLAQFCSPTLSNIIDNMYDFKSRSNIIRNVNLIIYLHRLETLTSRLVVPRMHQKLHSLAFTIPINLRSINLRSDTKYFRYHKNGLHPLDDIICDANGHQLCLLTSFR